MNHDPMQSVLKMKTLEIPLPSSLSQRARDNRRYQIALTISLATLVSVLAWGIVVINF